MNTSRWRAWLAGLVAVLAAAGITVTAVDNGPDHDPTKPSRTVTIRVDGNDVDRKADDLLVVPKDAAAQAARADELDGGLRDETPKGVTDEAIDAGQEQQDRLVQNDQLPPVSPDAAPSQRGCSSRFVVNHSSRRGVAPRLWVIHWTAGPNRPGIEDLLGYTAQANNPASQTSWHYLIDRDANCFYQVRESDKAWTAAGFNSTTINVEIVNRGVPFDPPLLGPAALRKLGVVISDSAKRWKIPLRRGAVSGCSVTRSGIVDHNTLKACGGGHPDVFSYNLDPIIASAKRARGGDVVVRAMDRVMCRKLNWWRRQTPRPGGLAARNAVKRRKALERRHLRCTARGPVRTG